MARFTSIGMRRKAFVPSGAKEARETGADEAGPSTTTTTKAESEKPKATKRKRRGTRGKDLAVTAGNENGNPGGQWERDPTLASEPNLLC